MNILKLTKTYTLQFLFLWLSFVCLGQIPSYYNGVDFSKNGDALKIEIANLITTTQTTSLPYTSSSTDTWDAVIQTDLDPNDNTKVLLFYGYDDFDGNSETDYTRDKNLSCHATPCSGLWTREHVFAKSRATPALTTDSPGSGTDVHNLRACDGAMNTTRSNRLYQDDSGNSHITGSGYWYPGDEWRGDVARIIMYMYVRYPTQCLANSIGVGGNTFNADMPDVFLQWNVADPVSQYEIQRNTVLEAMQGNRNPFIDNPYIATKIWDGDDAQDTWGVLGIEDYATNRIKIYPTVVSERLYVTNSSADNIVMAVYNINGRKINLTLNANYIDVRYLADGMYFLKIVEESSVTTHKFIKY